MKNELIEIYNKVFLAACDRSSDATYDALEKKGIVYDGTQFAYDPSLWTPKDLEWILKQIDMNKRIASLTKKLKEKVDLTNDDLKFLAVICNAQSITLTSIATNYTEVAAQLKDLAANLLN